MASIHEGQLSQDQSTWRVALGMSVHGLTVCTGVGAAFGAIVGISYVFDGQLSPPALFGYLMMALVGMFGGVLFGLYTGVVTSIAIALATAVFWRHVGRSKAPTRLGVVNAVSCAVFAVPLGLRTPLQERMDIDELIFVTPFVISVLIIGFTTRRAAEYRLSLR